jgi:hypothetical protein
MAGSQRIWQVRVCCLPFTVARHSKQIPIPQRGPRGWPLTEVRQEAPAIAIAAATVQAEPTVMTAPSTSIWKESGMGDIHGQ